MPSENLKKFEEFLKTHPELDKQIKSTKSEDEFVETVVQLGKENNFDFSAQEVRERLKSAKSKHGELNWEELDKVAGAGGCSVDSHVSGTWCA